MTEATLATATGLPVSAITQFEAGARKPSFDNLRRLAVQLSVTTDYLLGRVDDPDAVAEADPLFRHMQKMADSDREVAGAFMKMLIATSQKRKAQGT